jgi:peptide deformylase
MSILKVARMGHPVLRTVARPLERAEIKSAPVQAFIDDMIETMMEYRGVGLAAPQVHEGLRVFVAVLTESDAGADQPDHAKASDAVVLINPEITIVDPEIVEDWEGCLSIPDIRGRVPRSKEIIVRALDRRAGPFEIRAADFQARVIQHETDHLDGVLFFDRMRNLSSLTFLEEYGRYWRRAD